MRGLRCSQDSTNCSCSRFSMVPRRLARVSAIASSLETCVAQEAADDRAGPAESAAARDGDGLALARRARRSPSVSAKRRAVRRDTFVHDREADELDPCSAIASAMSGTWKQISSYPRRGARTHRRRGLGAASERRDEVAVVVTRKPLPCLPGRKVMPSGPANPRGRGLSRGRPSPPGSGPRLREPRSTSGSTISRPRIPASHSAGMPPIPHRMPARPPAIAAVVSVSLPYATARWIVSR